MLRRPVIAGLLILLAAVLVAGGAACLAAPMFIPFDWVRLRLDAFAADGSANAYTPAVHRAIVARLRYVGVAAIVIGVVAFGMRRALVAACDGLGRAAVELRRDLGGAARRLWVESPAGHLGALAAIVVVGFGVRVELLGWPMRYDESFTFLNYAKDPLVLGLTRYDLPNNHLFHTLLVHIAYRLFGDAPWALRLPALLAGVLVMPASYLAVRALYGPLAALLATALVAIAMPTIGLSTNARGYSLIILLFLLLVCLGSYLRRTSNGAAWVLFALLATLGLYTIPTGLYALATVTGWLLLSAWAGDVVAPPYRFVVALVWTLAATAAMTAVLYAPILVRTDLWTLLGTSYILSIKVRPVAWDLFVRGNASNVVVAWRRWASDWPWLFQAVWLAGIGVAVVLHRRVGRTRVPLVAGIALGCVPLLLVQRVAPPARIWIFLLPIFAGMGAAGVLALLGPAMARQPQRSRWVVVGSALLLLAVGALSVPARSRRYQYNLAEYPGAEQAVTFLVPRLRPGDQVLVVGMSQTPFLYYARRHGLPYLSYVYDYLLRGWRPLHDAARVFIVVLDPQHPLDQVMTEAQIEDAGSPVPVAQLAAGEIYVVGRQ